MCPANTLKQRNMSKSITAKSVFGDHVTIAGKMKVKGRWQFVITSSAYPDGTPGPFAGRIEVNGFALSVLHNFANFEELLENAVEITEDDLGGAPSPKRRDGAC